MASELMFQTPEEEDAVQVDVYDVVIVGGGPAGAAAAIYTARADLTTLVVDKGLTSGALAMGGQIANYPGLPEEISGAKLVEQMRNQAQSFGALFARDKALASDLGREPKEIQGGEAVYRGRTVIIATGGMGRTRTVPGEEALLGRGVSYCAVCDGAFFRGREVAVVGNNDEAVEEALFLTRFADWVHLLVHTSDLKASAELVKEVSEHSQIDIHLQARLKEVVGERRVEGVRIKPPGSEQHLIPVGGVFIYLQGNQPIVDFVRDQLPLSEDGCLIVDENMQTAVRGVFAAGDVLCKHLKQAVIAAAEGARAAMSASRHLSGREKLRPDWS